ncbi:MAG: tRNA pseudouridine(13) synthase TruD [Candidatus Aenigmarchaeota archaeon]|nr:tRNA pseudouridine(13) synthase TruD [Candidatus Aenigmarchaeota archaeon]
MLWTKSPGTGGAIGSQEDFVVEELPSKKYFIKFTHSGGVKNIGGPYTLALLTKKGMTTKDALKFLQKELGMQKDNIGYAGLKDKFAVTSQYVTIRGKAKEIEHENIRLKIAGYTDKMMQIGDLEGNRFTITLRDCKNPDNVSALAKELASRGLPNYFGPQRFGRHGDNHLVGKLVMKEQGAALRLINERNGRNFRHLGEIGKKTLKFYIHAYQSFLFNRLLDKYISLKSSPLSGRFPIVGYGTNLKNDFAGRELRKMLKKDGITTEDFSIRSLNITCVGSQREAFVKPSNLEHRIEGKALVLSFTLPKGSYATVLIREITKIPF